MTWPHDLVSWLTIVSILLGGLWWVLKSTIVTSIDHLRNDLHEIKEQFKEANKVSQDHGERILKLEVWKKDKFND